MILWLIREFNIYGNTSHRYGVTLQCWAWRLALLYFNGDADHAIDCVHPDFGWLWADNGTKQV